MLPFDMVSVDLQGPILYFALLKLINAHNCRYGPALFILLELVIFNAVSP